MEKKKNQQLLSTVTDLQNALQEWDAITTEKTPPVETSEPDASSDIRKKTRDLLQKLNEQIKDLDL